MSLDPSKKNKSCWYPWGTPEEYFPFKIHVAPLDAKDLEWSKNLSPEQRIEWLLMMQELLLKQFEEK